MDKYAIGLDFGTNSCRSLVVDISNGKELANCVYAYPSGENGVIIDPRDPNLARQNPADYITGIQKTISGALAKASNIDKSFIPSKIIGIGIDTTGSSPMPVDNNCTPLCFHEQFKSDPAAMVWLWKDHTSFREAELITQTAKQYRPSYMARVGGKYSSEWFWSKILHCRNTSTEVFQAAYTFVEICDWIPAMLTGISDASKIKRSMCAAGHKALFNYQWEGLPDSEFLGMLAPELPELRCRLYEKAYSSESIAGYLSPEWSSKLGLSKNVAVAVGAFDAHMAAVGAGIKTGSMVKIIGTSTCDVMIHPDNQPLADINGVCGIVDGSVIKGYFGIEAGQSAVGDIFLWFINNLVPEKYGSTPDEKFVNLGNAAMRLKPGESGLLALDWNNGNRTILVDVRLTGLIIGQNLYTQPYEIYRALLEATAFGALTIVNRIQEYGIPINEVINCGGLASKNSLLMQIYADILGRPMKISRSDQTAALGASIFAAVAAGSESGGYDTIDEAQRHMTGISKIYEPIPEHVEIYKQLFVLYSQLHDAFGNEEWKGNMYNVMKDLLNLRDEIRGGKLC